MRWFTLSMVLWLCSATANAAADYSKLINKYSAEYGIDPKIVKAVIAVESSGRSNAKGMDTNGRGFSYGLMQIKISTAKAIGFRGTKAQLLWPMFNIAYGVKYLRQCLDWTGGDMFSALDAYNRGILNVRRYPWRGSWEKHRYVGKVIREMGVGG